MSGYECFKKYESGEFLTKSELKFAVNYMCGYLNNPGLNYRYFYDMYSYISKSFIVCRWKKNHSGYAPIAKIGEAICKIAKMVNFLKDDEHKNCSCLSVYYDPVL